MTGNAFVGNVKGWWEKSSSSTWLSVLWVLWKTAVNGSMSSTGHTRERELLSHQLRKQISEGEAGFWKPVWTHTSPWRKECHVSPSRLPSRRPKAFFKTLSVTWLPTGGPVQFGRSKSQLSVGSQKLAGAQNIPRRYRRGSQSGRPGQTINPPSPAHPNAFSAEWCWCVPIFDCPMTQLKLSHAYVIVTADWESAR